MDKKSRIIIEVDDDLLKRVKLWTISHDTTMAVVGREFFTLLAEGNPAAAALLAKHLGPRAMSAYIPTPAKKRKRAG